MSPRITLTVVRGPNKGHVYSYEEPCRVVVGRGDECDIHVPTWMEYVDVSRRHCLFEIDLPTITVRDLGSLIGTCVNGVLIGKRSTQKKKDDTDFPGSSPLKLIDGDVVQVGGMEYRVGIHVPQEALVASFVPQELHSV